MNQLISQSRQIREDHLAGKLSVRQFLHKVNRLFTIRAEETTVYGGASNNRAFIQTMEPILIANIIDSDMEIVSQEKDENGLTKKVRAVCSDRERI